MRVVAGQTTAQAADYTVAGEIAVAAGAQSATARLTVRDDADDEGAEAVAVEIDRARLPAGLVAVAPARVVFALVDDDPTSVAVAGGGAVDEGATVAVTVTLGRALGPGERVTVPLVSGGTVRRGADYRLLASASPGVFWSDLNGSSPRVVFTGDDSGTVRVARFYMAAVADGEVEGATPETLTFAPGAVVSNLDLADPSTPGAGGTAASGQAEIRITDIDEVGVGVSVATLALDGARGSRAAYTLVLSSRPAGWVRITPTSGDTDVVRIVGTRASADGSVYFGRGDWDVPKTVTVEGVGTGSATVTHRVTTGDGAGYTPELAIDAVAVTADTRPALDLALDDAILAEGTLAPLTLRLAEATGRVEVATRDLLAATGDAGMADVAFPELPEKLVFHAGNRYTVTTLLHVTADEEDERNEALELGLGAGLLATLRAGQGVQATIIDRNPTPVTLARTDGTGALTETGGERATLTVTLGRALAEGEAVAMQVRVAGPGVTGDDYTLGLDGAQDGISLDATAPYSAAEPGLVFTGDGTVRVATLTLAGVADNRSNEAAREQLALSLGDMTSNLDRADAETSGPEGTFDAGSAILVLLEEGAGMVVVPPATPGVETRPDTLSVVEGGAAGTYFVRLATDPGASVMVTPGVPDGLVVDTDPEAPGDQPALAFTAGGDGSGAGAGNGNWARWRPVTVRATADDDTGDAELTIPHAVTGYGDVVSGPEVRVTVRDAGAGIVLDPVRLALAEGGSGTYAVRLRSRPAHPVTVTPRVVDSGDVARVSAPLDFAPGVWDQPQRVTVSGLSPGSAEILHGVTSQDAEYAALTGLPATAVVVAEDPLRIAAHRFTITAGAVTVGEGGDVAFTVAATPAPPGPLAVTLELAAPDGLLAGTRPGPRRVVVPTGGSVRFTVATADDAVDAPDGVVTATLAERFRGGIAIPATATASVRVTDDDPTVVTLRPGTDMVLREGFPGDGGGGHFRLALGRDLAPGEVIDVPLALASDTGVALPGAAVPDIRLARVDVIRAPAGDARPVALVDAATATPKVRFSGGWRASWTARVELRLASDADDGDFEPDRFTVALGALSDPALGTNVAGGAAPAPESKPAGFLITDRGGPVSVAPAVATEGSDLTFTVTLSGTAPAGGVTIDYETQDGNGVPVHARAIAGEDYTAAGEGAQLVIDAGETEGTITVTTINDDIYETDQHFTLILTRTSHGELSANGESRWYAKGTITDAGDLPVFAFESATHAGAEGEVVTVAVARAGATLLPVTLDHAARAGGSAAAGTDVTGTDGTLVFDPGETRKTFDIALTDDGVHEPTESLTLALALADDAQPGRLGTTAETVLTVTDGDPVALALAAGGDIHEGEEACFTVTADLAPGYDLDAGVTLGQTGWRYLASSEAGARTVTIQRAATTAELCVPTLDVDTNTIDGVVTATLAPGTGYTVTTATATATATASVAVDGAEPPVRVEGAGAVAAGTAAGFVLSAGFAPAKDLELSLFLSQTRAVADAQDMGTRSVTLAAGSTTVALEVATTPNPDTPDGTITARLRAGTGYALETAGRQAGVDVSQARLLVVPGALDLTEGGAVKTYTVALGNDPGSEVTVRVTPPASGVAEVDTDGQTSGDQETLTFTAGGDGSGSGTGNGNWAVAQTVTVRAPHDAGTGDDSAALTHAVTAASGPYQSFTGPAVAVTVRDAGHGIVLSPAALFLADGDTTGTYTIALASAPASGETVTITPASADSAVATVSGALDFTATTWQQPQTVTVTFAGTGATTITHAVTGAGTGYPLDLALPELRVAVAGLVFEAGGSPFDPGAGPLQVQEGGRSVYRVRLATQPSDDVQVAVRGWSGTSLGVEVPGGNPSAAVQQLTFTPQDWSVPQAVFLVGKLDPGTSEDISVPLTHTATGGGYGAVRAEIAVQVVNTSAGYVVPARVEVSEGGTQSFGVRLATAPFADVTVTLSAETVPSPGIPAQPVDLAATDLAVDTDAQAAGDQATLTFTHANWKVPQSVRLAAAEDGDAADDELRLVLTGTGGGYDHVVARVRVVIDDRVSAGAARPGITLAGQTARITEGGDAVFTVTADPAPATALTVHLDLSERAGAGRDVVAAGEEGARSAMIAARSTQALVTVPTQGDDVDRPDGTVTLALVADPAYLAAAGTAEIVVRDDEPTTVSIAIADGGTGRLFENIKAAGDRAVITLSRPLVVGERVTLPLELTARPRSPLSGPRREILLTATGTGVRAGDFTGGLRPPPDKGRYGVTFAGAGAETATVTLEARDDRDRVNESVTLSPYLFHRAPTNLGGGIESDPDARRAGFTVIDDDNPRLVLSAHTLAVREGDSTGQGYTARLSDAPTQNVTVTLTTQDPVRIDAGAGAATAATLTFTTSDWNQAQTVTVSGLEDAVDTPGGTLAGRITHVMASGDWRFNTRAVPEVGVAMTDNDPTGVVLARAGSGAIAEAGGTEEVTVTLARALVAGERVTVPLEVTGATAGTQYTLGLKGDGGTGVSLDTAAPHSAQDPAVVLDGAGARTATLTLTAIDNDDATERTVAIAYGTGARAPTSTLAGGLTPSGDVSVRLTDDDTVARLVFSRDAIVVAEGTATGQGYTVELSTAPTQDVTVTLATQDPVRIDAGAGAATAATLTFTTSDWSDAQTVTVTGLEDAVDTPGGTLAGRITHATASGDPRFHTLAVPDVTVAMTDNDATGVVLARTGSGAIAEAGGTAEVTVTLARALVAGERVTVPLAVTGATTGTHYTLGLKGDGGTGVSLDTEAPASAQNPAVVLDGAGAEVATLTLTSVDDSDETDRTIAIAIGTPASTLAGGVTASGSVSVPRTDNDKPGIVLSHTTLEVTEGDAAGSSYTVKLNQSPGAGGLLLDVVSSDSGKLAATPHSLGFENTDWNNPQTVTVKVVTDDDVDNPGAGRTGTIGHQSSLFTTSVKFANRTFQDVVVTIVDDEPTGLVLARTGSGGIAEDGGTEEVTLTLARALVAGERVTVPLEVTGATAGTQYTLGLKGDGGTGVSLDTAAPASAQNPAVVLEGAGAEVATLTLTAIDNADATNYTVAIAYGTGTRAPTSTLQGGVTPSGSVSVPLVDDDPAALSLSRETLAVTEGNSGQTYTVALSEAPVADVTVTLAMQDPQDVFRIDAGAGASTEATLTFTAGGDGSGTGAGNGNWAVAQTITVTGVDDDDDTPGAARTGTIRHAAASEDPQFAGLAGPDVAVTVTDDEPTGVTLAGGPAAGVVVEGEATVFTVTLARGLVAGETLELPLVFGGTATRGTDYTVEGAPGDGIAYANLNSGAASVTFTGPDSGATARVATFTLRVADDGQRESTDETVAIDLGAAVASGLGGGASTADGLARFSLADVTPRVVVSRGSIVFAEGEATTYAVRLATDPGTRVRVRVNNPVPGSLAVDTGTQGAPDRLEFTAGGDGSGSGTGNGNWAVPRMVTVRALRDGDGAHVSTRLTHDVTAARGPYDGISAPAISVDVTDAGHGVVVSPKALWVAEDGTASYTIVLLSAPLSGNTIKIRPVSRNPAVATVSDPVAFTAANWDQPQTVTVTGAMPGQVVINHSVSGSFTRYHPGTCSSDCGVDVTVPELLFAVGGAVIDPATEQVEVREGGSPGTYQVRLAYPPHDEVTVTVSGQAGTDLTVDTDPGLGGDQSTLTFTTGNWNTLREVRVSGAGNSARVEDVAIPLTHAAAGGGYDGVEDRLEVLLVNTTPVIVAPDTLAVAEGGAQSFEVRLAAEPVGGASVRVIVSGQAGTGLTVDTDTSLDGDQSRLDFTTENWKDPQKVHVSAAEDDDGRDPAPVALTLAARRGGYGGVQHVVTVTIEDDDVPGLEFDTGSNPDSLTERGSATPQPFRLRLATEPSEDVLVAVTAGAGLQVSQAGGAAAASRTLTFTPRNWQDYPTNFRVHVVADAVDQPGSAREGTLSYTVTSVDDDYGGMVVAGTTITIHDDDPTSVTLAGGGASTEAGGEAVEITVSLGRALVAGEVIRAPLEVTGSGIDAGDYSIAPESDAQDPALNAGVTLLTTSPYSAAKPAVLFRGDDNATVQVATLTLAAVDDDADEAASETLAVALGTVLSNLDLEGGQFRVSGPPGTASTGSATVTIADDDDAAPSVPALSVSPTSIRMQDVLAGNPPTIELTPENVTILFDSGDTTGASAAGRSTYISPNWWDQVGKEIPPARRRSSIPLSPAGRALITLDGAPPGLTITTARLQAPEQELGARDLRLFLGYDGDPDAVAISETIRVTVKGGASGLLRSGSQAHASDLSAALTLVPRPAGVTVDPQALAVTEGAGLAYTYKVSLDASPGTADVTVAVANGDPGAVAVDTDPNKSGDQSTLLFTAGGNGSGAGAGNGDWALPKTVTVRALDDGDDGNEKVSLTHAATAASGPYGGTPGSATLEVTVYDDDTVGVVLAESGESTEVNEDGTGDAYTIRLGTRPAHDVEVDIRAEPGALVDAGAGASASVTLGFSPSDAATLWSTPRTVQVSAVDDLVDNPGGARTPRILHAARSQDGDYAIADAGTVAARVTDDDATTVALARVPRNTGGLTEGSTGKVEFTVTLGRALVEGEMIDVPLLLSGSGIASGDFTLSLAGGTGVNAGVSLLDGGTLAPAVRFDGAGAREARLEIAAMQDNIAETGETLTVTLDSDAAFDADTDTNVAGGADPSAAERSFSFPIAEAGVTLAEVGPDTRVSENGLTADVYTVVLASRPGDDVRVEVTAGAGVGVARPGGAAGSSLVLTFTPQDWSVAQIVAVTGVDDALDNPGLERLVTIAHAARSQDASYEVADAGSVQVTVEDDEPTVVSLARVGSGPVNEGRAVEVRVTLARALVKGEVIDVPLAIGGTGVTPDDWRLAPKRGQPLAGARLSGEATATPKLTFSGAGARVAALELTPVADNIAEGGGAETFEVALGPDGSGANGFDALDTNVAGGADPDRNANRFDLVVQDSTLSTVAILGESVVTEGEAVAFVLTALPPPARDLTVQVDVQPGPFGGDYLPPGRSGSQSVVIPAGEPFVWYRIPTQQDATDEPYDLISATLEAAEGYIVIEDDPVNSPNGALGYLNDDDATTVVLGVADAVAAEGDATDTAALTLTLNRGLIYGEQLSVPLRFAGGTPGTDFALALEGSSVRSGASREWRRGGVHRSRTAGGWQRHRAGPGLRERGHPPRDGDAGRRRGGRDGDAAHPGIVGGRRHGVDGDRSRRRRRGWRRGGLHPRR